MTCSLGTINAATTATVTIGVSGLREYATDTVLDSAPDAGMIKHKLEWAAAAYDCRTVKHAKVGNAVPAAVVLTGLWIVLNISSPLDDTWNYLFGFAIGLLGLVAIFRG